MVMADCLFVRLWPAVTSSAILFYASEMQAPTPGLSEEPAHLAEAYLKSPNHMTHPVLSLLLVV